MKKIFLIFLTIVSNAVCLASGSSFDPLIGGDIRTKWKTERSHYGSDRKHTEHHLSTEANILINHSFDNAWGIGKLRAYASSANQTNLLIEKAHIGYTIFENENVSLSAIVGRNLMKDMFHSKMHFDSIYDGIDMHYSHVCPGIATVSLHGGPFVINSRKNQYGWAGECWWENLGDSPLSLQYSLAHWKKGGDMLNKHSISQMTAFYDTNLGSFYGSYLRNHESEKLSDGFYVGYTYGEIMNPFDWIVDVNVQYSKPLLTPGSDFKGLRRGINVKGMTSLTDALSMEVKLAYDKKNDYKKAEITAIYAW